LGVLFTNLTGRSDAIIRNKENPNAWDDGQKYFGSITNSMVTIFACMTYDSWREVSQPLSEISPLQNFILIFAMLLGAWVFFNVCIAIIAERTCLVSVKVEEKKKKRRDKAEQMVIKEMRSQFTEADADGSGSIDYEEFLKSMEDPTMVRKLQLLDIPVVETDDLFMMIDDDGSGEISVDEFVEGVLKLRGHANARDLNAVLGHIRRLCNRCDQSIAKVDYILSALSTINARVDTWWRRFEEKHHVDEEKLAQRSLWFLRKDMRNEFVTKLEKNTKVAKNFGETLKPTVQYHPDSKYHPDNKPQPPPHPSNVAAPPPRSPDRPRTPSGLPPEGRPPARGSRRHQ